MAYRKLDRINRYPRRRQRSRVPGKWIALGIMVAGASTASMISDINKGQAPRPLAFAQGVIKPGSAFYRSCADARSAGVAPLYIAGKLVIALPSTETMMALRANPFKDRRLYGPLVEPWAHFCPD